MDPGALLQNALPLVTDFALQGEQGSFEQFTGHAHHPSYSSGNTSAVDHARRDGSLHQPAQCAFAHPATNDLHASRFVSDRTSTSEVTSRSFLPSHGCLPTSNFLDSCSGSISASPSSVSSSLPYTNYQTNHYTGVPTFPGPVLRPQAFVPNTHAGTRVPSFFDGSAPGVLPPPALPSPILTEVNRTERDTYASSRPFLSRIRSQLSPNTTHASYEAYPHTPRTVLSGTASFATSPASTAYASQMASSSSYSSSTSESINFPWPNLEIVADLICEGQAVTPEIHAQVEKGFFPSSIDSKWTCYRRNYFAVACSFELHPNIAGGRMYLKRNGNAEQVQAMGMRLCAAVDGSSGKSIELIQHTPKRDNGPKTKIEITKVSPTPTPGRTENTVSPHGIYPVPMSTFHATGQVPVPYLPLQNTPDLSASSPSPSSAQTPQLTTQYPHLSAASPHIATPGQNTTHAFERVQFKVATANNGKRRASQQYFHLVVELHADVRKNESDCPQWVKIAQRVSEKLVVRGRSPSHYQNEGGGGQGGRGGSSSGSSSYRNSSAAGYGDLNASGFRGSNGGYSTTGASMSGYRTNRYGAHSSSDGSGNTSDSVDEEMTDASQPADAVTSTGEHASFHDYEGCQYYPAPLYEGVPVPTQLPLPKVEGMGRISTEPRQYAVKAEYADAVPGPQWQLNNCSRFQGVGSSRGYYPDLSAGIS